MLYPPNQTRLVDGPIGRSNRVHHYIGPVSGVTIETECPLCLDWVGQLDLIAATLGTFAGEVSLTIPAHSVSHREVIHGRESQSLVWSEDVREKRVKLAKLVRETVHVCRECHAAGMSDLAGWEIKLAGEWQTVPFLISNILDGWELDAIRPCFASVVAPASPVMTHSQRRKLAKLAKLAAAAKTAAPQNGLATAALDARPAAHATAGGAIDGPGGVATVPTGHDGQRGA